MKESLGSFGRSNEILENEEFQANRTRAQDPDWVKYTEFLSSLLKRVTAKLYQFPHIHDKTKLWHFSQL